MRISCELTIACIECASQKVSGSAGRESSQFKFIGKWRGHKPLKSIFGWMEATNLSQFDFNGKRCGWRSNMRYTIQLELWYSMYSAVCFATALP
jgi:hypothetical protein